MTLNRPRSRSQNLHIKYLECHERYKAIDCLRSKYLMRLRNPVDRQVQEVQQVQVVPIVLVTLEELVLVVQCLQCLQCRQWLQWLLLNRNDPVLL